MNKINLSINEMPHTPYLYSLEINDVIVGLLVMSELAAKILNVSRRRVGVFIREGRLPALKIGNRYLINSKDLSKHKRRRRGRPTCY